MIEEILSATKKYGATGVLACWLWVTSTKVSDLEDKLINCYEDQARITQVDMHNRHNTNSPLVAILPDNIQIKREDV
jgi:hypothetical protein